jgi:hypothetical protein
MQLQTAQRRLQLARATRCCDARALLPTAERILLMQHGTGYFKTRDLGVS